jgi:hypothetical protein
LHSLEHGDGDPMVNDGLGTRRRVPVIRAYRILKSGVVKGS